MYNSALPPTNSPANKTNELNRRAEGGRNFKVFFSPLERITELLSQTIANRDRQIEVVTPERQMREGETEVMKRHGGRASLMLRYSAAMRRRRQRKRRGKWKGRGREESGGCCS